MSQEQFRVHARTVDHLGQSQIADCPTAVSELWKNAYDAYARNVALHIFAEPGPMAAITDDGHGMSREEFVQRWLAIGTEHKASATGLETPEADRNGIPPRPTQGQKGIGRLSVAHLGQVVLVITKRKRKKYVAALVDWRVFENPFLMLDDIIVPVEVFKGRKEFSATFERMRTTLSENVVPIEPQKKADNYEQQKARHDRIVDAWGRLSEGDLKDEIYDTALNLQQPTEEQLNCWPTWTGEPDHGTALFVFNLHHELSVWVDESRRDDDDEVKAVKDLLKQTLISFYDPYADEDARSHFRYAVLVHPRLGPVKEEICWDTVITLADLQALEHFVEGVIDENGTFNGRVRVFGKDRGMVSLPSKRVLPKASTKGYLGPIGVVIGAFEHGKKELTTMHDEEHARWNDRFDLYSGFLMYRDGLRVLPYGRPDSDLFEIDATRNLHAGRKFWAHRRMFARITFTRKDNPNLLDKAGREGLRDNQARRELKFRIRDLLLNLAVKYFGTDSEIRSEAIEEAQRRKEQAIKDAGRRARKEIRAKLRKNDKVLTAVASEVARLETKIAKLFTKDDLPKIVGMEDEIDDLRRRHRELDIGAPPKLDLDELQGYRGYRDTFTEVRAGLDRVVAQWRSAAERARASDPVHQAEQRSKKLRSQLELKMHEWDVRITTGAEAVLSKWNNRIRSYMVEYDDESSRILSSVRRKQIDVDVTLERLMLAYDAAMVRSKEFAEGTLQTLAVMKEQDIDVESLLRYSSDKIDTTIEKAAQVNALAQIGITSEIIGHEFESLDNQIRANMAKMPAAVKSAPTYERVRAGYDALSQKLRFLTPLKLSRRPTRERIRGAEIEEYIVSIFAIQLAKCKVSLSSTTRFKDSAFSELRSRIYPVFVNLVNNAMYWVSTLPTNMDRRIVLERVDDALVIGDNGPGVDPDDVDSIFDLFFSRRDQGQGVGLYLCRQNLAAGGHQIEYATDKKHRVLPGANFALKIRGLNNE